MISSRVASLQERYLATRPTKHFLENPEKVFSRGQLLDAVWHHNENIEVRTVDVHIRRLRQALAVSTGPELVRTVSAEGY